jgi:hypothetical protein
VVNLLNKELDLAAISVLARGLNFAHMTNLILNISGIAGAVIELLMEAGEEIRWKTCCILRKTKTWKNNYSKALLALGEDEDLVTLTADKGSAMVVMNSRDYSRKMNYSVSRLTSFCRRI